MDRNDHFLATIAKKKTWPDTFSFFSNGKRCTWHIFKLISLHIFVELRQTLTQRWIFAYHGWGNGKQSLQFVLHPAEEPQPNGREAWEYLQLVFWAPGERHWGTSFGWPSVRLCLNWFLSYITSFFIVDQWRVATRVLDESWDGKVQRSVSSKWWHPLASSSDGAARQLPGWPNGSWAQNLERHPQSCSGEEAHPRPLPHVHVSQQS